DVGKGRRPRSQPDRLHDVARRRRRAGRPGPWQHGRAGPTRRRGSASCARSARNDLAPARAGQHEADLPLQGETGAADVERGGGVSEDHDGLIFMRDATGIWNAILEKSVSTLSATEHLIKRVNVFLIEFEMGGWLYNLSPAAGSGSEWSEL